MTRSEILAPLDKGEGRFNLTVGIFIRGAIRRAALHHGVDFYEEKGWFESAFVLRGPVKNVIRLKHVLDATFGDN